MSAYHFNYFNIFITAFWNLEKSCFLNPSYINDILELEFNHISGNKLQLFPFQYSSGIK